MVAVFAPAPVRIGYRFGVAAPPPSLERLLELVAQGDREAFEKLYDEVAGTVFGLAKRILVDPARAQEVAQEVLIEVWQKAGDYQPRRASAITWIAVMTRRRAIDAVRSSEASRRREDNVLVEERWIRWVKPSRSPMSGGAYRTPCRR